MRIISWNINGLRAAVKKDLIQKLDTFAADIICLQEIRAQLSQAQQALEQVKNYQKIFSCAVKPGYSGVAILSKIKPKKIITNLGLDYFDHEGRVIITFFDNFILANIYFPNGSGANRDNSRVDYKLKFYDYIFAYLQKFDLPKIILGDFNTAHEEIDLARPKTNIKTSGFLPIERKKFSEILKLGYKDIFREHNPDKPNSYTWWSHRSQSRARNIGWRIDYILCSKNLSANIKKSFIWPDIMGSDHCPIGIDIFL